MNQTNEISISKTNKSTGRYRWSICALLFFATTINYLDRQVLSLTWSDFIAPEFHWTNNDYGNITALFSIFYAVSLLFAGRFVDWLDTKKGFLWAIGIWSIGACLHAFCGIATAGIITGDWFVGFEGAKEAIHLVKDTGMVINVSVALFIFARFVLAVGEAGNFPAAIKTTAEYFPKKDRAFSTSIFNAGATVGALAAPISIPFIAKSFGWEMSFIIIGALGFVWMGFWVFMYDKPERHPKVSPEELAYIQQDDIADSKLVGYVADTSTKVSLADCFKYKQTWAFAFGKFMTDGVWWFFLFWLPAFLKDQYGMTGTEIMLPLVVLYSLTMFGSIGGGWFPMYFIRKGYQPYDGRMKAMLLIALIPLVVLLAQPLGYISFWMPVILIGIGASAHQAWSANIFTTVSDMFPKKAIGSVVGIGGMAGGIGGVIVTKSGGALFDHYKALGHIETGYTIMFAFCAVAYLIAWIVMKILVPKYKPITDL